MAKITKTLGPIHFEDLDPHRFEDLVRELIYDFKEWQNIEATGRGGADDGFDVRAWEKIEQVENSVEEEEEENIKSVHPMNGNLWMIQCKREKKIGPKRVAYIIQQNIDKKNPPYGYILVAPADFSKKSYDTFREELRKQGVMEFHLWSKAALEDMLHMPKNDRILFTFFGISLVMRKRSRKIEVRFAMNNKNKLMRILGGGTHNQNMRNPVLIRDIDDRHYPFESKYKDFKKYPRWREQVAISLRPLGLVLKTREFFAYIDRDKEEYDFVKSVDLVNRESENNKREKRFKKEVLIRDYWEHLSRKNQAYLEDNPIILFEDMIVIDDKGDATHNFPHIYCEYKYKKSPFRAMWQYLVSGNGHIDVDRNNYKRVEYFPKKFPKVKKGRVIADKFIELDNRTAVGLKHGRIKTIYDVNGKYDFLRPRDKIRVKRTEISSTYERDAQPMSGIEVMHKYKVTVKDYMKRHAPYYRSQIEEQVGRKIKNAEQLTVFEVRNVSDWEFERIEKS